MKETAVEWLEQKAKEFAIDLNLLHYFQQAKEMQKQQIIDASERKDTDSSYLVRMSFINKISFGEQYYNETFNK
jgi:hypothetical protein